MHTTKVTNPLVSILMPAYNSEKYISEAIESICSQSYNNWELIVIDDGSTDNTAAIVRQYAVADKRIKYSYQENKKQGEARNAGIKLSRGNLIAFLDSDDLWLSEHLATMIAEFSKDKQAVLFSNAYIFRIKFDRSLPPGSQQTFKVYPNIFYGVEGLKLFLEYNRIPNLTVLAEKEALVKVGLFSNNSICEDYDMWLRLLINGYRLRAISSIAAAYRLHSESTTAKDSLAVENCMKIIYSLKINSAFHQYKHLFTNYLAIWSVRKLNTITLPAELIGFLKLDAIIDLLGANKLLLFLSKLRFLFALNKNITLWQLKQQMP